MKVLRYETGQEIPEGAIYLKTIVEGKKLTKISLSENQTRFVWHYFLVSQLNEEVKKE
jgi:hypothetical protein